MRSGMMNQILRAFVTSGLVISLLATPSAVTPAAASNPSCSPTQIAVDSRTRSLLFTDTTLCDWTVPANVSAVTITMAGGGGGGGGGSWSGTHGGGGGGGGGAGLLSIELTLTSSSAVSIKIGEGGSSGSGAASQGTTNGSDGGDGGETIFNATHTALGGLGGFGGVGDVGGAGGANGGISSTGILRTSSYERRLGGSQNNGNGGGGSAAQTAAANATSTSPGTPASGSSIYPRLNFPIGAGGGGGANQTSERLYSSAGGTGADSTFAAIGASAASGAGSGGGHGCGSAASTCANRNGAAGSSGFILITFAAGPRINVSNGRWSTSVGESPTWPVLSTYGVTGSTTWRVSPALPQGITLDANTGVISGTPTEATAYNGYYFRASDAFGEFINVALWALVVNKGASTPPTFTGANIVYGEPTALSVSGGSGSGLVTFVSSSADCVLSGSRGETVTAQRSSGTCAIVAQKAADANWYASSASATFTMTKQVSTISLSATPSSPREEGSTIFLTATTGAGQTGSVTFSAGGTPISSCGNSGVVQISGSSATCAWVPTSSGSPFTVSATYSGDANYQSASASTINYTIHPSISLSYPGISTTFGTSKSSTPTISGGTGSSSSWTWEVVKASDSSTVSGISINSSGVVSVSSSISTGTYLMRVTATDTVGITKSASINIVVGLSSAASPTITSAESSMTAGGVVHLTATVLAAATGTIAFKFGSTTITGCGTVSISSGTATCDWTTSTASGSPFSITAIYSGDGSYASSTSSAISLPIFAPGAFTYTSQSKSFGAGASISPSISGGSGGFASWSVVNSTDSNSVNGVTINEAGVVNVASYVAAGSYTLNISASDSNGIAGSGTLSLTISQATTSLSLTAKTIDNRVLSGGTLGRQVRLVAIANIPISGSVTISDARGTICNAFAMNGSAECWWAPANATYSPYALTATFAGDGNGTAATSNTLSNFVWSPAISVSYADTSVETGRTVTITPTISGGTGARSSWLWQITQNFTGYSIGGITINGSGVVTVAGSILPDTYTMVIGAGDLAGAFFYDTVVITVSDLSAPSITLSSTSETGSTGSAISGYTVTNSGSDVTSFAIDQALPAGLSFNTSSGRITGTPTETASALVFTLTASNFVGIDTATYTLTINVGSGGSTASISIALAGGATTAAKGRAINIIATIGVAGKVKFFANGKTIGGCAAKSGTTSATCSWKPSIQGQNYRLTALLDPASNSYTNVTSAPLIVGVSRRTGLR